MRCGRCGLIYCGVPETARDFFENLNSQNIRAVFLWTKIPNYAIFPVFQMIINKLKYKKDEKDLLFFDGGICSNSFECL